MKETFPGYYNLTEVEFKKLWGESIFIFDANVLLNLYRYSPETTKDYLELLTELKEKLWIPFQAAFEYQKRRLEVIIYQENAYQNIINILNENSIKIQRDLNGYLKHSSIKIQEYLLKIEKCNKRIISDIRKKQKEHPNLIESDTIRDQLTKLFDKRVGKSVDKTEMEKLLKIAKERCIKKIPPGFKDFKEQGNDNNFGDVLIWFEVINKAKKEKKSIIFITDDRKEDWWYKSQGKTISPRPELINEIKTEANVIFYMYQSDRFLKYANKYLQHNIENKAIEEVKKVREEDERNTIAQSIASWSGKTQFPNYSRRLEELIQRQQETFLGLGLYNNEYNRLSSLLNNEELFKKQQDVLFGLDVHNNEYNRLSSLLNNEELFKRQQDILFSLGVHKNEFNRLSSIQNIEELIKRQQESLSGLGSSKILTDKIDKQIRPENDETDINTNNSNSDS